MAARAAMAAAAMVAEAAGMLGIGERETIQNILRSFFILRPRFHPSTTDNARRRTDAEPLSSPPTTRETEAKKTM